MLYPLDRLIKLAFITPPLALLFPPCLFSLSQIPHMFSFAYNSFRRCEPRMTRRRCSGDAANWSALTKSILRTWLQRNPELSLLLSLACSLCHFSYERREQNPNSYSKLCIMIFLAERHTALCVPASTSSRNKTRPSKNYPWGNSCSTRGFVLKIQCLIGLVRNKLWRATCAVSKCSPGRTHGAQEVSPPLIIRGLHFSECNFLCRLDRFSSD